MFLIDNYSHVVPNVVYVKENICGPGINPEDFNRLFKATCNCTFNNICVDERCRCIASNGKNYISSFLSLDKLDYQNVFECGPFCACNFSTCPNRLVQKGPNPRLEVRPTERMGYGLFTLENIPVGTFICEYAGEVISDEVAAARRLDLLNANYLFTLRENYGELVVEYNIDAYKFGNIGRYVNHSCSPNSTVVATRTGSLLPRAAIFTTKLVKINDQITISYGEENISQSTVCYCRSLNCTGFVPSTLCSNRN